MPREFSRVQRINDVIQHEIARLIQQEIKDPRIGMVTVSRVEVSRDVSHAKIYITVLGEKNNIQQTLKILNKASNFLRYHLAHNLNLRTTPLLHFHFDEAVERGRHLSDLIDNAIAMDQKLKDEDEGEK